MHRRFPLKALLPGHRRTRRCRRRGLFRLPADEPDREREDDRRRDDRSDDRCDAVHEQREEEEKEIRERQEERQNGFQPLAAADEDEQRAEEEQKTEDGLRAVIAIDRAGGEGTRLAPHGDDRHARLADRTEEQAVRAVRLGCGAVCELQAHDLIADAAAVLLQVIPQDLRDRRALEAAPLRVDELWFLDVVEVEEEGEQGDEQQRGAETLENRLHRDSQPFGWAARCWQGKAAHSFL